MIAKQITKEECEKKRFNKDVFYNRADFCDYNAEKVENVYYLLCADNKKERFLIPFGKSQDVLKTPFSAPFCFPREISSNTSVQHYGEAVEQLIKFAKNISVKKISITFPPFFYFNREISYWVNACINKGGKIVRWDLNYALDLMEIQECGYNKCMEYNGRKNLRLSHERGCSIRECTDSNDIKECYKVIKENRESKGYPLRMTFEQVEWTRAQAQGKWFCVECENEKIASAVVFPVTAKIAQVIYWGNVPGSEEKKPINALAEFLVTYYTNKGFEYLDIGPSTDQGIPNYGLIDFKESIGCRTDSKVTVEFDI